MSPRSAGAGIMVADHPDPRTPGLPSRSAANHARPLPRGSFFHARLCRAARSCPNAHTQPARRRAVHAPGARAHPQLAGASPRRRAHRHHHPAGLSRLSPSPQPRARTFSWEIRAREARALQADLRPNPELEREVENVAGSGAVPTAESQSCSTHRPARGRQDLRGARGRCASDRNGGPGGIRGLDSPCPPCSRSQTLLPAAAQSPLLGAGNLSTRRVLRGELLEQPFLPHHVLGQLSCDVFGSFQRLGLLSLRHRASKFGQLLCYLRVILEKRAHVGAKLG